MTDITVDARRQLKPGSRRTCCYAQAWELAPDGDALHVLLIERGDNTGPSVTNLAAELVADHRDAWQPLLPETLRGLPMRFFEAYGSRILEAGGTDPAVMEIHLQLHCAVTWMPIRSFHADRPIVDRLCAAAFERAAL